MKQTSIHYGPDSIHVNHHYHPEVQEVTARLHEDFADQVTLFRNMADTLLDLNSEYARDLESVRSLFEEDGLQIAPLSVYGQEEYKKITAKDRVQEAGVELAGGFLYGRAWVREHQNPMVKEVFGSDFVIGMAIHESAHSTGYTERSIVTSKAVARKAMQGASPGFDINFNGPNITPVVGFQKYTIEGDAVVLTGEFVEEAFADLTRVKYMQRLSRGASIGDQTSTFERAKLRYVGDEEIPNGKVGEDGILDLPVRFAYAGKLSKEGSAQVAAAGPSSIAAYGLELLEKRLPGLYEQMQKSRKDPSAQSVVIQRINSVQPGLYTKLRKLQYTDGDFREGLQIIKDALAASSQSDAE